MLKKLRHIFLLVLTLLLFHVNEARGQSPVLYVNSGFYNNYVNWDAYAGAIRYMLYWSPNPTFSVGDTATAPSASLSSTVRSYVHTGLPGGTTYYYILAAYTDAVTNYAGTAVPGFVVGEVADMSGGGDGDGFMSTNACWQKLNGGNSSPIITLYAGTGQNHLFWEAEGGAGTYTVSWSTSSSGPFTDLPSTPNLYYTHTGLSGGTTYYYYVTADYVGGTSCPSATYSVMCIPEPDIFNGGNGDGFMFTNACWQKLSGTGSSPPITAYAGTGQNFLFWETESGAGTYTVMWNDVSPAGPYNTLASTPNLYYTHSGLTGNTTYYYQIVADFPGGNACPSVTISATAIPDADIYSGGNGDGFMFTNACWQKLDGAGSSPPITAYPGMEQNFLFWEAESGSGTYTILWSTSSSGPFSTLANTPSLYYTHTGLTGNTTYYYQIVADFPGGNACPSGTVEATAVPFPDIYSGGNGDGFMFSNACWQTLDGGGSSPPITVYPGQGQVFVFWEASGGASDYTVEFSTTLTGPYSVAGTTANLYYTHTGLTGGTTLYYQVTPNFPGSNGCPSNPAAVTVIPHADIYYGGDGDGFMFTNACWQKLDGIGSSPPITIYAGTEQNFLFWEAESGAGTYTILWNDVSASGPYNTLTTTANLYYTHTGLTGNTTYYYQIVADFPGGTACPSATVAATAIPSADIFNGGNGDGFMFTNACWQKLDGIGSTPPITLYPGIEQNFLFWEAESGAGTYTILLSNSPSGPFNSLANTANLYYTHTPISGNNNYYYQIVADFPGGTACPSETVSAMAIPQADVYYGGNGDGFMFSNACWQKLDGASSSPQITAYGGINQNYIFWEAESGSGTYTVSWSLSSSGPFTAMPSTPNLYYTHTGLTGNTTYYYVVTADFPNANACPSNVVNATAISDGDIFLGGSGDGFASYRSCSSLPLDGIPAPVISPAGPIALCTGQTQLLQSSPASNYQWLQNGVALSGEINQTYTVQTGGSYKVQIQDLNGCLAWSNTVNVNLGTTPTITADPLDENICEATNASFSVTASGSGITFEWQESTDGGTSWAPLVNSPPYSGVNTPTLNIVNATAGMDNNLYLCIVSGCGTNLTSNHATLSITPLPAITAHPADITQAPGNAANFTIIASNASSYQWYENQGSGWNILNNGGVYSGVSTASLSISDVTGMDAYMYQCVVSGCSVSITSNSATLTVGQLYSITAHPVDVTVCPGTSTSFSITASGSPNYLWYENQGSGWNPLSDAGVYSGVTTATLSISNVSGMNAYSYQCVISGSGPSITSNTASITLHALPSISAHPVNVTECPGTGSSFAVTAGGYNITYLWYENQGSGWNPLADAGVYSGVTTASLVISDVSGMNGYLYQCVVSGCGTSITSNNASISLHSLPGISAHPANVTECPGGNTSFSVTAGGYNITYLWYENQGSGWNPLADAGVYSGVTTASLAISDVSGMNGYLYQCVVSGCGTSVTSNNASISLHSLPGISAQPANVTECPGDNTSFSLTAGGYNITYLWYENQGSGWSPLADAGVYSGVTTSSLAISDVSGMNGYLYQCVVSGCGTSVTSNNASISLHSLPGISAQPADVTECPGAGTSFSLTAGGYNITYLWYENQGSGWNPLADAGVYSGVTTASLAISDVSGMNGYLYQCIVSGCGTSITSNNASISLHSLPGISAQPANVTECPGDNTSFSLTAGGYNITYQWYENQGSGWNPLADAGVYSGVNTASLAISDVSGMNGYLYQCVVSGCGTNVTSGTASLNVFPAPIITSQPSDALLCSGGTTFSVSASGMNISYQWYENQGSGWIMLNDAGIYSGTGSQNLVIADASTLNTYQYQCIVSTCSFAVTSNTATITYSSINNWLGHSTDWEDVNNWSCGVPTSTSDAYISGNPVGGLFPILSTTNISVCNNIAIAPMGQINITNGSDLRVYGNWSNNGNKLTGNGTVIFAGSNQDISGNNLFRHITINTGSVTTLTSPQEVSGIVLCNGNLNAGGNLTLLSDATGTALISGAGSGNVNGTVVQQRFVAAAKAKGYKHFSSAFSNATIGQLANFMTLHLGNTTNSPYPTVFIFSETAANPFFANGWVEAAPQGQINTLMPPAQGYTAQFGNVSAVDVTSYLSGEVNNGNVSINVTRNNPGSGKGDGWNLVGNPYPSPIDLDYLPFNSANLNKSVSLFISTSTYNGYYGYYNAVLHLPLNGGTRHLGALHAFFVQCNNTSGGTLTFTNAMRSSQLAPQLYKENNSNSQLPLVRLSASSEEPNSIKDETAIMFLDDATWNNDPDYDAAKIMNSEPAMPNLYSVSNEMKLALNGLPYDFSNETVVPLGFSVTQGGLYTINAEEVENIPSDVNIYLEDKAFGKIQDIRLNPDYTFTADINTPAEGRFFLRFGNTLTGLCEVGTDGFNFAAWSTGDALHISVNGQKNNAAIQLFDALGRLILHEKINSDGRYTYYPQLPAGTYTLRYLSSDNTETVKLFMN